MAAPVIAGSLGGYSAEFLTPEQQERFTFVKTKLCGHKEVDVANLRKSGMSSVVDLINQMQWTEITTFSEVSYPDLVKAFFVCMRTEEDGSLVSSVKGTMIRIDPELLKMLFNVKTSGFSGVHIVDAQVKVVEKMGQAIRSRNLKKSGFSVENGVWVKASVSEGEAIIDDTSVVHQEMGSADMIPELPVESVSVPVVRAAESSGPSLAEVQSENAVEEERVSVAASEFPEESVQIFAERRIEDILPEDIIPVEDPLPSTVVASILSDIIDSIPFISSAPEACGSVAKEAVASGHFDVQMEDVPVELEHPDSQGDFVLADAPIQGEQVSNEEEAPAQGEQSKDNEAEEGDHLDQPVGSAPENDNISRGSEDVREGETASSSSSDDDDDEPSPASEDQNKGKEVESEIPMLSNTPFERPVKQKIIINLKPVIERLDAQGQILCSLQADTNSIFMSQASASKELASVRNAMKWFNKEMGTMKEMLEKILKAVGDHIPPHPPSDQAQESGPSGPAPEAAAAAAAAEPEEVGPEVPTDQVARPPGPSEQGLGPSGPLVSESVQIEAEEFLAPKPPAPSSPSHTPIPPTPPSTPTAPPAPQTFKKPQSRPISSPTPFPSQSTSTPASSTSIPSPSPIHEAPPASSAGASSSSSGPSLGPVNDLPTSSHSFLHPTPPPSFITIIPERAQLNSPFMEKIKDEFEEGILRSVLKVGEHIHMADPSSPAPKKRKLTSTSSSSSDPKYPPLWFSLTVDNKHHPLYREYLSKVVFATIINLPFQNLTDHLNTILPYTSLSKSEKSKIFSLAHSKSVEQWGKGHKDLLKKFILAKSARFPPRDHSLTLSEWFRMHHQELWAPYIQKEIKMIRHFMLFNNYRYINNLPEVQLSQFKRAISALAPAISHTSDVQGHVSAEVLAPILSECERLTSSEWSKFYPLSAQQLLDINEAQAREGKPAISPATFLDMNSIHLVDDPFKVWEERYKVYVALHKALRANHNHYPVTMDQFLSCASFGTRRFLKMTLDKDAYADLLYQHLDLHLKWMASTMGPSYSIPFGVFKTHFEEQEAQAWETISHFASLLSLAFYLPEDLVVSRVLFPSVVKEDLVVSRVLFPSVVKEDLVVSRVLFPSVVKEDLVRPPDYPILTSTVFGFLGFGGGRFSTVTVSTPSWYTAEGWRRRHGQARAQYAEAIGLSEDGLVEMLVLDGCFIIEYFVKRVFRQTAEMTPLSGVRWGFSHLRRDLMLLENQIPFFVLVKLFSNSKIPFFGTCQEPLTLMEIALRFLDIKLPMVEHPNPKAVLHLYHLCLNPQLVKEVPL
ncbi:hypothetical protein Taro_032733 [Colocasia esculenta]|uniref:Uncharacterized protein n=1 Tax=Colocasia esculenta TaxID=4460 RepID=A0A843VS25_COLES|nr:hypothetical protein [Colocasia esculenta]